MDIGDTLAPTSDQLDAIDLATSGPRTFTIEGVTKGSAEQPVQVKLVEFDRVWRPSKGMRRVLASGWTTDASTWAGRRITLFCDPAVTFGNERPGGIRIKAMSDLPDGKPMSVPMLIARGKSGTFKVEPLPDQPTAPTAVDVAASTDPAILRSWWRAASPELRTLIEARVAALSEPAES